MCLNCFSTKKQKANFTDNTEKRDTEISTKGPNSSTTPPTQPPPTIPPITNNVVKEDMSSPKVAIVIYSTYGHIAKRSLRCSSNIVCPYSSLLLSISSCRGRESWHRKCRWDSWYISVRSSSFFIIPFFLFCLPGTRVAETLSQEILTKMHAPAKPDYPIITPEILTKYDAFIFGIPTRYGNMPAQWKVRFHWYFIKL